MSEKSLEEIDLEKKARNYAESQFYYDTESEKAIAFQSYCEGFQAGTAKERERCAEICQKNQGGTPWGIREMILNPDGEQE